MKCYKCNGTGYYDIDNECPVCDGTGEYEPFDADIELDKLDSEPQTNEEWFDGLSTEEKAEFLSKIEEQYPCGSLLKCDVTCGYHSQCRGDDVAPTNKEAWVEWLKQPYTP